jgi:hypothetical protein
VKQIFRIGKKGSAEEIHMSTEFNSTHILMWLLPSPRTYSNDNLAERTKFNGMLEDEGDGNFDYSSFEIIPVLRL